LDEYQIELYDKEISNRGYGRVAKALDRLLITRKSNSPFPSIAELKNLIPFSFNEEKSIAGSCGVCSDGLLFGYPINEKHSSQYVFKCTCSIGSKVIPSFPKWVDNGQFVLER
jgi:hypothetical protein